MTAYTIRVMAGVRKPGTCDACRQPLEFRLNVRGKWMPFDAAAQPLHTERAATTLVRHDLMSRDDLHFTTCKKRPAAAGAGARA